LEIFVLEESVRVVFPNFEFKPNTRKHFNIYIRNGKEIAWTNVGVLGRSQCDTMRGKRRLGKATHSDGQPKYNLNNPKQQKKASRCKY
jgi:hypothetical protein